jgi:hypothetical protein
MWGNLDAAIGLFSNPRRFSNSATLACVDLMREFLRREALWSKILGVAESLPFADLPNVVSFGIQLSIDHLGLIDSFSTSLIEKTCCVYMLKWYQIPKSVVQAFGPSLPGDPYLPILKLFEVGGFFTREHRVNIDINQSVGVHAGMVQQGSLDTPFAMCDEE